MCRGVLPTKLQFHSNGIDVSASCLFCANSLENAWHIFISCPFAISYWSKLKVSDLIDSIANTSESLVEWFFKLIKTQNNEVIGKISVVLWAIWIQHNNRYWNGSHESAVRTVYLALEFLFDWISIQESAKTVSQVIPFPVQQHWQRPLPGFVKCNIDAAVFLEEGKSSWGIVVRDSQGLFLHAASRVVNDLFHVRELETLGLREALSWIKQLGFERVIFETDSLQVVQALQNRDVDFSEFGALIKDCLSLLQGKHYFSMAFTKRQNNVAAHILARNAIRHIDFMIWNDPPVVIQTRLCTDAINS